VDPAWQGIPRQVSRVTPSVSAASYEVLLAIYQRRGYIYGNF
jgi:hypothetical protein